MNRIRRIFALRTWNMKTYRHQVRRREKAYQNCIQGNVKKKNYIIFLEPDIVIIGGECSTIINKATLTQTRCVLPVSRIDQRRLRT